MTDPRRVTTKRVVLGGYLLVLVASSLVPGGTGSAGPEVLLLVGFDKWMHALSFAVLTFLALQTVEDPEERWLEIVVLAIGLGAGIEILQGFVPGRSPELADLLADVVGVALGSLVDHLLSRR